MANKKAYKNLGKYAITGGPGRPKGALQWKNHALSLIGKVYADREDEAKEYLKKLNIEKFLKDFVLPFLPKNVELSGPDGSPLQIEGEIIDLTKLPDKELKELKRIKDIITS